MMGIAICFNILQIYLGVNWKVWCSLFSVFSFTSPLEKGGQCCLPFSFTLLVAKDGEGADELPSRLRDGNVLIHGLI